jgi:hypothetical protein
MGSAMTRRDDPDIRGRQRRYEAARVLDHAPDLTASIKHENMTVTSPAKIVRQRAEPARA